MRKIIILLAIAAISFISCEKESNTDMKNSTLQDNFYVAGYDVCSGVHFTDSTSKAGGYVFVSEDLNDTLLSYNFPDTIFNFPADCMTTNVFGINFFPQQYRNMFKVSMTYTIVPEEEQTHYPCITLYPQLYFGNPMEVHIHNVSAIE
ncbi:MAG: hypothetical protein LBO06_04465 [Bacteroidales bacterium]|jgi:hypothetical protein|nr:hypothetical protein [Bacteroidales bacterium]